MATKLHKAVANNDDNDLRTKLLHGSSDIDAVNDDGITALAFAARRGKLELMKILIAYNADLEAKGAGGGSALWSAVAADRVESVDLLLAAGADVESYGGYQHGEAPLHVAARHGRLEVLRQLIEAGANVSARDRTNGQTPLIKATNSNQRPVEIARELLAANAPVDEPQDNGATPLIASVTMTLKDETLPMMDLLMEAGANVNARGFDGQPVLHFAAWLGPAAAVEKLLNAGADVHAVDDKGKTALCSPCWHGKMETVKLLLDAGIDPNIRSTVGKSPLDYAREKEHDEVVQLLVSAGAG